MKGDKHIYFLRRVDGAGPIKIGCSVAPAQRLATILSWSPEPLCIICTAPGGHAAERAIHKELDRFRLHGEWFEASREVMALVTRVATTKALPDIALRMDAKWQLMADMYQGGMTLAQIGSEFGLTRERVRQLLRKSGVESLGFRDCHKGANRKDISAHTGIILLMAQQGEAFSSIGKTVGVSGVTIKKFLHERGVCYAGKRPTRKAETLEKARIASEMYRAGDNTTAIADRLGMQQPAIYRLLRIAGVTPDRRAA